MRRLAAAALLLAALVAAGPAAAQADRSVVVINALAADAGDALALSVYFTVRDEDDRVVPRGAIDFDEQGSVELLGASGGTFEATVADPDTPIRIVLLIDVSGSMANVIGDVREAAKQAVEAAPPEAELAIYQFSDVSVDGPFIAIQPFTPDRGLALAAIDAIEAPKAGAPTCLYNASYRALDELLQASQNPEDRRAVIVFTDGRDERAGGQRCSTRDDQNVIDKAQDDHSPVHTIGLCSDARCSNVDRGILEEMARQTAGFAAFGQRDQLDEMFRDVMEGIKAQWVARARLLPRQGSNNAVFSLTARGAAFNVPVTFDSPKDYKPPAAVRIVPAYDQERDTFRIALEITNPQSLGPVVVELWDKEGNTQLDSRDLDLQTAERDEADRPIFVQPTEELRAGAEYCFYVKQQGQVEVLAEHCVTYSPTQTFDITSVEADLRAKLLTINLRLDGLGTQTPIVDGQITEAGQFVGEITRSVPEAGRIQIPLPDRMLAARERKSYLLRLTLQAGEQTLSDEQGFEVDPLEQPSLVLPIAIGVVLALTMGALLWLGVSRMRARAPAAVPRPQPFVAATVIRERPRLRLRVVRTPAPSEKRDIEVTTFPAVLGRGQVTIPIQGDDGLSRAHVELGVVGEGFYVKDLGSVNGTFLNGARLEAQTITPVVARAEIRLGPHTVIEIEPVGAAP